jgi:hypothetical protein
LITTLRKKHKTTELKLPFVSGPSFKGR